MATLWVPDGHSCRVEWYVSKKRAVGVESITDDWLPHDPSPRKLAGYQRDDERELEPDTRES